MLSLRTVLAWTAILQLPCTALDVSCSGQTYITTDLGSSHESTHINVVWNELRLQLLRILSLMQYNTLEHLEKDVFMDRYNNYCLDLNLGFKIPRFC